MLSKCKCVSTLWLLQSSVKIFKNTSELETQSAGFQQETPDDVGSNCLLSHFPANFNTWVLEILYAAIHIPSLLSYWQGSVDWIDDFLRWKQVEVCVKTIIWREVTAVSRRHEAMPILICTLWYVQSKLKSETDSYVMLSIDRGFTSGIHWLARE